MPRFAEFFCGGGMVRAGLGEGWACAFANDIDPMKCAVYRENWSATSLLEADIKNVSSKHLLQPIDLYWASSPCQDFSLAGKGLGFSGSRGGTFFHWVRLIKETSQQGFRPRILAFENVVGLLSRNDGADMRRVISEMSSLGYWVGALEIDAAHYLPQSRPRLFVVAMRDDLVTDGLTWKKPLGPFQTPRIANFVNTLPKALKKRWVWWQHELPSSSRGRLDELVDEKPDTPWLCEAEVAKLIRMMSPPSLAKLRDARLSGGREVGTLYKRGRPDETGVVRQRAEVRFDGIAGCLRTPRGGSSRQTLLIVEGQNVQARLLSSREVARLMGLPETYKMPPKYNQAYHVAGDGVAVPIIRYLDETLFQGIRATQVRKAVA